MKETHEFLMPDYYPGFSCKMGDCRRACCDGWPVSISMKNYFSLLGVTCDPPLRRKLDVCMHLCQQPTEEEYARFEPDWQGRCPLHMADGRCAIHAQLGEDTLPDVCNLFPRGVRCEEGLYEISCANSCERTLELLLDRREPLTFITKTLTTDVPPQAPRSEFFETLDRGQTIRLSLIYLMQDRRFSIPERLIRLGRVLETLDPLLIHKDAARVDELLASQYAPLLEDCEGAPGEHLFDVTRSSLSDRLRDGLNVIESLTARLDSRSSSIREEGESALSYFTDPDAPGTPLDRYMAADQSFNAAFPEWECFFEHMLVNHMFFMIFPFEDRPLSLSDECVALCAVYALLRFLTLGNLHAEVDEDARRRRLVDLCAAAFRLMEHTGFDRLSVGILRRMGVNGRALVDLISL